MSKSKPNPEDDYSLGSTDVQTVEYLSINPKSDYDVVSPASDTVISESPPIELLVASTDEVVSAPKPAQLYSGGALPVGTMLGHFKIEKFIGGGGMGRVYLALDTALARKVAIKVLPRQRAQDSGSVARFMNEARSAARLNHEHIAQVYFAGEQDGMPFIAFEYVEGTNVRALIESQGIFSLPQTINYVIQITHAISHASAHSVIHRDVKPSNILITSDGQAKLIDMGLARLLKSTVGRHDLTASGVTLGTFDYISPEQARDPRNADIRSDIYSLGCTFFYMLTGRPPFPEGTVLQKLLQHQGDEPPDVRVYQPKIPLEIAQIIQKMMAKDPRQRYQDPNSLLEALVVAAEMLGLQPSGPGKIYWTMRGKTNRHAIYRHIPWISTVCLLLIALMGMQYAWIGRNPQVSPPPPPPLVNLSNLPTVPDMPVDPIGDKSIFTAVEWHPKPMAAPHDVSSKTEKTPTYSFRIDPKRTGFGIAASSIGFDSEAGLKESEKFGRYLTVFNSSRQRTAQTGVQRPSAENSVVIVDPSGRAPNSIPTMEMAFNTAGKTAEIELHFNGSLEMRPIQLTGRNLKVRAGTGFTPNLTFRQMAAQDSGNMITINGGEIEFEGISFELNVPTDTPAISWTMFDLPRPGKLSLKKCIVTVRNILDGKVYHTDVAIFRNSHTPQGHEPISMLSPYEGFGIPGFSEIGIPVGDRSSFPIQPPIYSVGETRSGEDISVQPVVEATTQPEAISIKLNDTLLRGEANVVNCESNNVVLDLDNVAIASSLPVFATKELKKSFSPGSEPVLELNLRHVSIFSRSVLCRQMREKESHAKLMPIKVKADYCVFNMNQKVLISSSAFESLQESVGKTFLWSSTTRNYYESMPIYWWKPAEITAEDWQRIWNVNPPIVEKLIGDIPESKATNTFVPRDFTILPQSSAYQACPGISDPDNRTDAGVRTERLPRTP